MIRRTLSLELLRKFRTGGSSRRRPRHTAELDNLRRIARRSQVKSQQAGQENQVLRRKLRQVRRFG